MKKRIWLIAGISILCIVSAWEISKPKPLIKNGALSVNFDGWETNAGTSIFRDPSPRNLHYYYIAVRTGGIFHLGDDRFAAIGAGNTPGSVLAQTVALDGKGGRYELSFLFGATGDRGLTALLDVNVTDNQGRVLAMKTLTNSQPAKTYYVPRDQQRLEKLDFEVPAGMASIKVSFADKSPNGGVAVDPLIKNVSLKKMK